MPINIWRRSSIGGACAENGKRACRHQRDVPGLKGPDRRLRRLSAEERVPEVVAQNAQAPNISDMGWHVTVLLVPLATGTAGLPTFCPKPNWRNLTEISLPKHFKLLRSGRP